MTMFSTIGVLAALSTLTITAAAQTPPSAARAEIMFKLEQLRAFQADLVKREASVRSLAADALNTTKSEAVAPPTPGNPVMAAKVQAEWTAQLTALQDTASQHFGSPVTVIPAVDQSCLTMTAPDDDKIEDLNGKLKYRLVYCKDQAMEASLKALDAKAANESAVLDRDLATTP